MAKLTSGFGVLLTVIGIMGYVWFMGAVTIEFGVLLIVCGVLANTEDRRRRMICMHLAVLAGFASFAIASLYVVRTFRHAHRFHAVIEWAQMQRFQEVVAMLCLIYVLICLGSFILARRGRAIATPARA